MLTKELSIAKCVDGQVFPDRLSRTTHAQYVDLAKRMCDVYANGQGSMRKTLHNETQKILESDPECPIRRIGAFCKLLDDRSVFDVGKPKKTALLRQSVFKQAAKLHPLVANVESILDHPQTQAKDQIAAAHNTTWPELEQKLFCDIIDHHRLVKFNYPQDTNELLASYNVAQTQASLLSATKIVIDATGDWKGILRYAKLASLMHRIEPIEHGYRITLDGPASLLRSTHRYGFQMAKFLPGLLSCSGWSMRATIRPAWTNKTTATYQTSHRPWILKLDDQSGLKSNAPIQNLTDSGIEQKLIENWNIMKILGQGNPAIAGWDLVREGDILVKEQRVFFPDFTVLTPQGDRILLEIAGFWTQEYQKHKANVLRTFHDTPMLLAIPQSSKALWKNHLFSEHHRVIFYRDEVLPGDIIRAIEENS